MPAKTVQELIALIKANPGKFSYASPGVGTTPHLSGEMFRVSHGLDLVPGDVRRAPDPPSNRRVGGHTQVAFTAMPPAVPQIKEGTLRALVVTSEKRSAALPDVPTVAKPDWQARRPIRCRACWRRPARPRRLSISSIAKC